MGDAMRFDPLFDELTYGLPAAPVEALIGGTRYAATADYDADNDRFDYRLTIAPSDAAPFAVSAVRLGLLGRHRGARIVRHGSTTTIRDTTEIADVGLRGAVELALARASAIGAGVDRSAEGLRRKGVGFRKRSQRPHVGASPWRLASQAVPGRPSAPQGGVSAGA